MKEDRYRCLGLTLEQKRYIKSNIDKNYYTQTISIEHMYLCLEKNSELFKNCIVVKDDKVIVQKIIGTQHVERPSCISCGSKICVTKKEKKCFNCLRKESHKENTQGINND